ncbi:MAG: Rrf2 family transcriptional regulator [Kiritimatiellae bacterium]|nr:Rrf2 family transcriptional regulator [Kiritimatiellia bacterium]MDD5522714.1 Rrf2 family transcriptional regulator [Kiritimatiellia bacterium]
MKLSTRSEYACLALVELSERYGEGLVRIGDIVKKYKIPKKYLEHILLMLRKAGYVMSRRGVGGGCQLARSPDRISVAEIVRLMDGPIAPVKSASKYFYKKSPIEKSPVMLKLMKEVRDLVSEKMEKMTFGSLVGKQ